jgi:hypothetical protein
MNATKAATPNCMKNNFFKKSSTSPYLSDLVIKVTVKQCIGNAIKVIILPKTENIDIYIVHERNFKNVSIFHKNKTNFKIDIEYFSFITNIYVYI